MEKSVMNNDSAGYISAVAILIVTGLGMIFLPLEQVFYSDSLPLSVEAFLKIRISIAAGLIILGVSLCSLHLNISKKTSKEMSND